MVVYKSNGGTDRSIDAVVVFVFVRNEMILFSPYPQREKRLKERGEGLAGVRACLASRDTEIRLDRVSNDHMYVLSYFHIK